MKLILDRCAGDLLPWNPSERLCWFRGPVEVGNPLNTAVGRVAYYHVEGLYLLRRLLRVMLAEPSPGDLCRPMCQNNKSAFYQCQFNDNNPPSDACSNILGSTMMTNNFMSFSLQSSGLIIHVSSVTTLLP